MKSKNIKISNVQYEFPNFFYIDKINYKNEDNDFKFENLEFSINTNFKNIEITDLKIENIKVKFLENDHIEIQNLNVSADQENYKSSFNLFSDLCDIDVSAIASKDYLSNYFVFKSKVEPGDISESLNQIKDYILKHSFDYKPNFIAFINLQEFGTINLVQKRNNLNNKIVEGLSIFCRLDKNPFKLKEIKLKLNSIKIPSSNIFDVISGAEFTYINSKKLTTNLITNIFDFTCNKITCKNRFDGSIPSFKIQSYSVNNKRITNFFSNSEFIKASNEISIENKKINRITGLNEIQPKNLDIKISAFNSKFKFFDGDSLKINISNIPNRLPSQLSMIKIKASKFSVLEAPPADCNASGYLSEDLSLNFNKIRCVMGHSNIYGSYTQGWKSFPYEFILKGNFYPQDINNWLGNWWETIWKNFNFDIYKIAFCDFIISGNWKNNHDTKLNGAVHAKNFEYKDFLIQYSNFDLQLKNKITSIKTSSLNHSKGELKGLIKFYNNAKLRNKFFEYSINGILPLNKTKKVFGSTVGNYLTDFNLTSVLINSKGCLPVENLDLNISKSDKFFYDLDFSTENNGTWSNIDFQSFKGNLSSDLQLTSLKLPKVDFADGKLSLNLSSNANNRAVVFNLELTNANIQQLIKSFFSYNRFRGQSISISNELDFISENGIVDLNLNATGISNDITGFKGTGKIKAKDKELSKLRLLGFLSRGLSELPIPFPTGTLKFDTLEGLFELEYDKLLFDEIVLSGLLSKIENKGTLNFVNGELDINLKVQLIGNLPIPILKQFAKFADPISSITEIKLTGSWSEPKWKLLIRPLE